jgi:predicted glycosyltransferase
VKPALLMHCQHSVGLGHLTRSFALAEALAASFDVTLLCGGEVPRGVPAPDGVELVWLPRDGRREAILGVYDAVRPRVLVLELFPFGRRKLADELLPLLDRARSGARPPVIAASVRDILVRGRRDQQAHDEVAAALANQFLDAVLVHADPRLARWEETFRTEVPLRVPVHHTGYVVRRPPADEPRPASSRVLVSAGGGRVGARLLHAAVEAHALLAPLRMRVVAGPFLPEEDWRALRAAAVGRPGLELRRTVGDLGAELRAASASVSQCGYNTALEVLRAGVPALVVPYAEDGEDEQLRRARRLARLGAVRMLPPSRLDGPGLAAALDALRRFRPRPLALDLDGARAAAALLVRLCGSEPQSQAGDTLLEAAL